MLLASPRQSRTLLRKLALLLCLGSLAWTGPVMAQGRPTTGRAAAAAALDDPRRTFVNAGTLPGDDPRVRSGAATTDYDTPPAGAAEVISEPAHTRTIRANRQAENRARLRGDHEENNLLLLVWQPEWEAAVKHVAASAARDVEVQILVPRGAWAASRALRRWAEQNCVGVSFQRYDTAWIRDYGPLQFEQGGTVTWRDFGYDQERPEDDALPVQLAADFGVPLEMSNERLDGGALVNNGDGLCVMTDRSLDEFMAESPHRKPQRFAAAMGCRVLTVVSALPEEQTGHADVSVQFLARDVVAVASMNPQHDPQHARLLDKAAHAIAQAARRAGKPMRVIRVPMTHKGEVFHSYVNAVRGGQHLFVPSYSQVPATIEALAHAALAQAVPHLKLVPVPSDEIAEYGGALHCITLGLNVPDEFRRSATCRRAKYHRRRQRQPAIPTTPRPQTTRVSWRAG